MDSPPWDVAVERLPEMWRPGATDERAVAPEILSIGIEASPQEVALFDFGGMVACEQ